MIEIINKKIWIIKHIGLGLLGVGLISLPFQSVYPRVFPYNVIIIVISLIFQIIGWKEPVWFLTNKT